MSHKIWYHVWKWAVRRHSNKSKSWIKTRYFRKHEGRNWVLFDYDEQGHLVTLFQADSVSIRYHIPIRSKANPYDSSDEMYFEQRQDRIMMEKLEGKRKLKFLYHRQKGLCPVCSQKITKQTGWNCHHIIPKYLGGASTNDNLVLLHPVCHIQVHSPANSVAAAALTKNV